MKFVYTYKSSDAVRHEAEISAPSRDEAFAALRKVGIRPIKMMRKSPPGWLRALPLVTLVLVAAFGTMFYGRLNSRPAVTRLEPESQRQLQSLKTAAEKILAQRAEAASKLKLKEWSDYAHVQETADLTLAYAELDRARSVLEWARVEEKGLFRNVYRDFAADAEARKLAQQLYGETMERVDAEADRLDCLEYALTLLDLHRGEWRVERGRVRFADARVQAEFDFATEDVEVETSRWRKDFGSESGQGSQGNSEGGDK